MKRLARVFPARHLETEAHLQPYQATSPSELYDSKRNSLVAFRIISSGEILFGIL